MDKTSSVVNNIEEEEDVMLPGFRFHPTDEELVGFYLRRKVERKHFNIDHLIKHVDIYKYDPWDLIPKVSKIISSSSVTDKEGYFFCRRGRKYRNSIRPNRVTGSGFWKATGIDKPIHTTSQPPPPNSILIGLKKSLVYYRGSAGKGTKTDWMMHEFRLPPPTPLSNPNTNNKDNNLLEAAEVWTLCRIFKRDVSCRKYGSGCQNYNKKNHKQNTTSIGSSVDESEIMERKVGMNDDDQYLVGGTYNNNNNNHLFAAAAGTMHPVLVPSNYLSFSSPISSGDDEYLGQHQNWDIDQLRPLVLDHYST